MASRRHFLQTLMAAFAGSALIHKVAPAEINPSWLTAKPLPPSTDMALDWWSQVADEALRILEGEMGCLKIVSEPSGPTRKLGDVSAIREPMIFEPWYSLAIRETEVLLDQQAAVNLYLDESESGLSLKEFSNRCLVPAMCSIAGRIKDIGRGAEYIVSAKLPLPSQHSIVDASALASSKKLNLRAIRYNRFRPEDPVSETIIRFDMLWGALRPS